MFAPGLLLALTCVSAPGGSDDTPSFKSRGSDEKAFVARVGDSVVRAARVGPLKVTMEKYELTDPKKGRKEMKIVMNWHGGITKKKYTSTIVVKIEVRESDRWEVVTIDYTDTSLSLAKPNKTRIQELAKKLNQ